MRRCIRLLATFLAIALPLLAQQDSIAAQSPATLSTRSDLVLVPVIVTDKSGNPVTGLAKDAFRIEENGKLRAFSLFEETQAEKLGARPKELKTDTYSNFLAYDQRSLRITSIVLDMLNTPWLRQTEGKKQLVDFLLRVATRDEPMAIFCLNSSGLHQLHPFTRDTAVLVLALQKLKLSLSSEERMQPPTTLIYDPTIDQQASDEEQLMSEMMRDLDDTISANYQRMATRQTLYAMTQLARAFQAAPGRKTVIWATAGFPFIIDDPQSFGRQGDDLRPEYEDAWRALDSANIAVYPVDLGSVEFTPKALPSANATVSKSQISTIRGTNGASLRSPVNLPYDEGVQQRLTMHAFANATGGQACVTISELEKCFAEAVDDSRAYYLLGYYLGGDTQLGWRKLKVKVTGEGLHVRCRSGFYVAPKLPDTPEERRKELVDALSSTVQYTGLHLTARLQAAGNTSASTPAGATPPTVQTKSAEFMVGVMGDSIAVNREKGNAIDIQITTLAFDSNRKSVATSSQAIAVAFKPERLQKILETGLGIPEKIDLPPGKYEIKFAVRDNLTGLIGTVSVPVDLQ
jgi:VWFA-related protein